MGDETTKRTKDHLIKALQEVTDDNIESVKERDDTLHGLAAVRDAIRNGQIVVRVYDKAKFHAKLNLMHAQNSSRVDFATLGSSNFTNPGLTQNVELNSFITDPTYIEKLNEWYDARWEEASEVKAELLRTIERHLKKYPPFTEFCDTARYLYTQLQNAGFEDIEQIDSRRKVNREEVIERFSPCYNGKSPKNVVPVQTLITTDVLAEGLNLQDASIIINYDLHWNPVRLMQRIGRLDRRLDPENEL